MELMKHRAPAVVTEPVARPVCGATNGDLVCTLEPHDTALHLDEEQSTVRYSATFKLKTCDA